MRFLNPSFQDVPHHRLASSIVFQRAVNAQRASRPPSACRLRSLECEAVAAPGAARESAADGPSPSGRAIENIPILFESLVDNLPSSSKRRKAVLASSTLASSIMGWGLGDRNHFTK